METKYEYNCEKCGNVEISEDFSSGRECSECEAKMTVRQFVGPHQEENLHVIKEHDGEKFYAGVSPKGVYLDHSSVDGMLFLSNEELEEINSFRKEKQEEFVTVVGFLDTYSDESYSSIKQSLDTDENLSLVFSSEGEMLAEKNESELTDYCDEEDVDRIYTNMELDLDDFEVVRI